MRAFLTVTFIGLLAIGSLPPGGYAAASGSRGAAHTMAPHGKCPDRGTWPGPNGSHYLNQLNDGTCGILYSDVSFPDKSRGTPSTLTMDTGTWTVEGDVYFEPGSKITVNPGVTLVLNHHREGILGGYVNINGSMTFEHGSRVDAQCPECGIIVSEYSFHHGVLKLNGTGASPVVMSGNGPGSWMGLVIHPHSTVSINGLRLSDAGAPTQPCNGCTGYKNGIFVIGDSPTINDSTIFNTSGNGIEIAGTSAPALHNLTLTGNTGYGIQYDFLTHTLNQIDGLQMSKNGRDAVRMVNPTATQYSKNDGKVVWPNLGYPLIDDINTGVQFGAHLTIAPGTTVEFGKGDPFFVGGSTLIAHGSPRHRITFTSDSLRPAPGAWPGLVIAGASTVSLQYVNLQYAGAANGCPCGNAAIHIDSNSPEISDTSITQSSSNDVLLTRGARPVLEHDGFGTVPAGSYGVLNYEWGPGDPVVDATKSWWGSITGPFHPKSNAKGKGSRVSDGVSFQPWLHYSVRTAALFDWSLPDRFGLINADGMIAYYNPNDPRIGNGGYCDSFAAICPYVHPKTYALNLDACDSFGPSHITSYAWTVSGHGFHASPTSTSCALPALAVPEQGSYTATLTVTDKLDGTDTTTRTVTVKDMLIVSIGDSIASGEGNPDSPQQYSSTGSPKRGPRWEDSLYDPTAYDQYVHSPCHRSEYAGPAQAALALERSDPHSSVTFISLACSGAGIVQGLLGPYAGIEQRKDGVLFPSQVDQLARIVCFDPRLGCPGAGSRRIDALLVSAGGNDMHFSDVIQKCILDNSPPNPLDLKGGVDHPCYDDPRVTDRLQTDLTDLPGLYTRLAASIKSKLLVGKTYITEYPDPTRGDNADWCGTNGNPNILQFISLSEAQWASQSFINPMNTAVHNAATAAGWQYVGGITSVFRGNAARQVPGHGYCATDHWFRQMLESAHLQGPTIAFGVNDAFKTTGTMHPNSDGDETTRTVTTGGQWVYKTQILEQLQLHL